MFLHLAFITMFAAASSQTTAQTKTANPPPRDAAGGQTSSTSDGSALARAWAALAGGKHLEAVQIADRLLQHEPWNHPAQIVRLRGLTAGRGAVSALDAYEQWLADTRGGRGNDDVYLLDPIAAGMLTEIGGESRIGIRVKALERLAAAGVSSALVELQGMKEAGPLVDAALAALGDKQAAGRLQTTARGEGDQRLAVEALADQGRSSAPVLLEVLRSNRDTSTQAAAAAALGDLGAAEAVEPLRAALKAHDPFLRSSAAVALARLNDQAGADYVQRMLASDIPDLQLMAARVWGGKPGPWVDVIRPLLRNQDGLIRLEAAKLVAPVDKDGARQVLTEGLADQNPVVRAESARIVEDLSFEGVQVASIADLRARLRDSDPAARLHAASALLGLARPAK